MNKWPNFLVLGIIVVFGIVILSLVMRNYANWRQQRDLPLTGDEAVVVSKRAKHRYTREDKILPNSHHFITFHIGHNGDQVEMRVSAEDFSVLQEGDLGILWHHGILFKRFDRK